MGVEAQRAPKRRGKRDYNKIIDCISSDGAVQFYVASSHDVLPAQWKHPGELRDEVIYRFIKTHRTEPQGPMHREDGMRWTTVSCRGRDPCSFWLGLSRPYDAMLNPGPIEYA